MVVQFKIQSIVFTCMKHPRFLQIIHLYFDPKIYYVSLFLKMKGDFPNPFQTIITISPTKLVKGECCQMEDHQIIL
jgi:hypothetical protein